MPKLHASAEAIHAFLYHNSNDHYEIRISAHQVGAYTGYTEQVASYYLKELVAAGYINLNPKDRIAVLRTLDVEQTPRQGRLPSKHHICVGRQCTYWGCVMDRAHGY